jgi:hypothetical protein
MDETIDVLTRISAEIACIKTIFALINKIDDQPNSNSEPNLQKMKQLLIELHSNETDSYELIDDLQGQISMANNLVLLLVFNIIRFLFQMDSKHQLRTKKICDFLNKYVY